MYKDDELWQYNRQLKAPVQIMVPVQLPSNAIIQDLLDKSQAHGMLLQELQRGIRVLDARNGSFSTHLDEATEQIRGLEKRLLQEIAQKPQTGTVLEGAAMAALEAANAIAQRLSTRVEELEGQVAALKEEAATASAGTAASDEDVRTGVF